MTNSRPKELQSAIDILATMVGFDTTSRNSNLELTDWACNYLSQYGARLCRVPSDDGQKTNLIASFGPNESGGIVLSGHSDVVPIDDQDWSTDPWQLTEKLGKLYGRGTCDMKGFSACFLALVPEIAKRTLKSPIHYALSYDEEVGCIGAPRMVAKLAADFPTIDLCIVGEPTDMKVISAHKGIASFTVEVTGHEAHSSRTDMGVSAIMSAIPVLNFIAELGQSLARPNGLFTPGGTSLTIGLVEGGTAVNILAHHCKFVFDIRFEPDFDLDNLIAQIYAKISEVDAEIKARAPEGGAKIYKRSRTPGLKLDISSKAESFARAITGDNEILAVAYAAEAGLFQGANIPTIICGPGSILQAHQADEFVEIAQLKKCIEFLHSVIDAQS